MKIHGIELEVGQKPPAVTSTALLDFNDVFLTLMKSFERGDVVIAGMGLHNRFCENVDDLKQFGSFSLNKVWKNLAFKQLVSFEKRRESFEEDDKQKKKTLTILKPTPLAMLAHEKGDLITVLENYGGPVQVGIGLAYGTFEALWKRLDSMCMSAGVAKTRVGKWYYEFKTFYKQNLLDKPKEEAEKVAIQWARQKIASAPTRFGKRNRIKQLPEESEKPVNHSLTEWK